jgi:MFS family permease
MLYKLNVKRTIFVGFAFFLICAFWQAYDAIMPLILVNKFGLNQTASGGIMALDNVFALFLLPLFGSLSDRHDGKYGKRTPFIVIGTVIAIAAFVALTFIDNLQLQNIAAQGVTDMPLSADGAITNEAIVKAWEVTASNPAPFVIFIALLLIVLLAMSTFRSPAVALMPDVTAKPLRSRANAIINLMGTAGGIIVLVLGMIFGTSKETYKNFTLYVIAVCAVMAIGLVLFIILVKEKKWAQEAAELQAKIDEMYPTDSEEEKESGKLSKAKFVALLFILSSVFLWFMGYNAVTSKFSLYATNVLKQNFNLALIIAQAAAIVSYVPVGFLASKIGRKKCILIGVGILFGAFFGAIFIGAGTPAVVLYIVFALAGIGWATINVNSYPMVVELSKGGNVGKYTGYYYTASMAAQVITPLFSGLIMDLAAASGAVNLGMGILFPYASIFVALSFLTMLFVKFGDAQDLGGKTAKELVEDNFASED